jgi:hypothetical protein
MNTKVKNTLEGRKRGPATQAVFNAKTILLVIFLGVFSFSAYFVLAGFAGDLKSGNNGGSHALSKSAIGYAGLLQLLKLDQNHVGISRSPELIGDDRYALRVVSLNPNPSPVTLDELTLNTPTLIIMPKWQTGKLPGKKGWVRKRNVPVSDTFEKAHLEKILDAIAPETSIRRQSGGASKVSILPSLQLGTSETIDFYNFEKLQTIAGSDVVSIIVSDKGTILAQIADQDIYILSDPDFLNTRAMAQIDLATFALSTMRMLETETGSAGFVFDLSLHGYARGQNLIKLALTPPFLGATLCLLAMAMLIAWQAYMRFGSPIKSGREIALGKLSLIYNAAGFIKRAGRENKMAPDYAKLTRKLVAEDMYIPGGLGDTELNERLDAYSKFAETETNWTELDAKSRTVKNAAELLQSAQKLFKWRGDISNGRK